VSLIGRGGQSNPFPDSEDWQSEGEISDVPPHKKIMYTVNVGSPDPSFGNILLEQFGGSNGELAAAMHYSIQGLNCI